MNSAKPDMEIDACWKEKGVFSKEGTRCAQLATYVHCHNCPDFTRAARLLLDRELDQAYRRELTRIVASGIAKPHHSREAAFAFRIGREWLSLPVGVLKEVIPSCPVHSIPHKSGDVFLGLVSIRGKLELHFSLAAQLRIPADPQQDNPGRWTVVCEREGALISFSVDAVRGVLHYHDGMLCPLPVTLSHADRSFCITIVRHDDTDYGLLDPERLFPALLETLA